MMVIFRLILPYEFFFTKEIEFIYALPNFQKWLEHKVFGFVAVKRIIVFLYVVGLVWTLYKKYFNPKARMRRRLLKGLTPLSTPAIEAAMASLQKNKKWRFDYEIYCGDEYTQVPMMYGLLKPRIFLPDYDCSQWCLSYWLEHECTHFMLKDSFYMLCIEVVLALYYFLFPKRMRKAFKHLFEYRCDETVLRGKTEKERWRYVRSIEYVLEQSGMKDKLSQENKEFLNARKERILNPPKQSWVRKAFFYILAAGIFVFSFAFVIQPRIEPKGFGRG